MVLTSTRPPKSSEAVKHLRYFIPGLILFVTLVGCQNQSKADLRVEDMQYSLLPGGARIITGQLHNISDIDVSSAQIMISLFDEHNQKIGQLGILVKNIDAGKRVAFREPIDSDDDIRAARVKNILVL